MSDRVEILLSKFRAIYDAGKIDYVKVYYAGDGIMWLSSDDIKAIYSVLETREREAKYGWRFFGGFGVA